MDKATSPAAPSRIFTEILAQRGLTTPEAVEYFLTANLERDWLDPYLIDGMEAAVARMATAAEVGERVCVFGDYDLDGISATAILVRGMRALGIDAVPILPHRIEDGYGLSDTSIERIVATEPHLLVTVDTGISARDEVRQLRARGIDVIVTDHHEPSDRVPEDIPVVNPKLDAAYGVALDEGGCGPEIAGAGVALKVIQALGAALGQPELWREYLDIATLGTVADAMPLRGENRALVKAGLAKLAQNPSVGITALAASAAVDLASATAERISFSLAPRLNAAGRIGTPLEALNLLLTDDYGEALRYASLLDECNRQRRRIERDLMEMATAELDESYRGERAIVLAHADYHDGVKGIIASRLAERYGVPAFLCSIEDGIASCSGRSVGQVDLFTALKTCSPYLERWGGHYAAAGLSLKEENIDAFRTALLAHLDELDAESFTPVDHTDALVDIDELTLELVDELAQLEPFGEANERPLFLARNVQIADINLVGKEGTHLKFSAVQGDRKVAAIYFRCPPEIKDTAAITVANVIFTFEADEWSGRRCPHMVVQRLEPLTDPSQHDPARSEFVSELFEHADETLTRRDYDGILDASSFFTKLAGVTFEGRQEILAQLREDDEIELVRDVNNAYDPNAIAVVAPRLSAYFDSAQLGFLNRDLAVVLAPAIDEGTVYLAEIASITGGPDVEGVRTEGAGAESGPERARGLNIVVRHSDGFTQERRGSYRIMQRARYEQMSPRELEQALARHFIGDFELHDAQKRSLEALEQRLNTLTVMATGRGKSLIFHMHAAKTALLQKKASIFVYPLRALVADQAYHLENAFAEIGLSVAIVTGESSSTARAESFEALREGTLDVILTTPEFLHFHAEKFAVGARIGFVVVDEAHHIGQAKAGNRPAYAAMRAATEKLGNPTALAVTATADDEVADAICEALAIDNRVLDHSMRDNLCVADERGCAQKMSYVLELVGRGEKVVIYVNSRHESVKIARTIRQSIPELAWKTVFYNGGLGKSARHEIERRFRDGRVQVVVATSAFGEGVNIPDIRHVVLYHLPFSAVEFNQMAGRSGRDGARATVHLLFGEKDAAINDHILASLAPPREVCAAVYQALHAVAGDLAGEQGQPFSITNDEIALRTTEILKQQGPLPMRVTDKTVSAVVAVFRELGFLTTDGRSSARRITLTPRPERVELERSIRYLEGKEEMIDFTDFKEWVMQASAEELLDRFNKPILPTEQGPR
ncbi:MAG: single-stranded-DNA-specific exonuclease RecJ [Coriobacteriia bacterium]|nr:single-stranded-DNA-specific exonuclease RecJ [Coriobacteriia bacterium]